MKKYLTYNVKPKDVEKKWFIIDAAGQTLGKVAVKAAMILRGKNKPIYTPYLDTGDNVIIINSEKIVVTGNKGEGKMYYTHSGYLGSLKANSFNVLQGKFPTRPLELAIKGMLPKGPLGRKLFRNLRVYKDDKHGQISQKPEPVQV
ncbi:MAG TPA: 50S ribosomal protein L13 [Spirochaetota bacterium]|nr:50S ribosomal protein L13 [Spirochaetota bacterium]HOS32781.1 50S ribosomal protein L13 [Spirochaetota bacterium]HOS56771.1 50S ribosomal protein L13 [Spirochaetota bacterium]HPK61866.1 50S ribosomal protein L13 [Spirochaetota bacterium]HQF76625.1 50S ribosomal protein L13 [Spirochaetota bacterium]